MHLRQAQNQPQVQPPVHQVPNFQAGPAELQQQQPQQQQQQLQQQQQQQQLYQQIDPDNAKLLEYARPAMATYNVDGSIETVDQAIAAGKLPPDLGEDGKPLVKAEFSSFMNNLKAGKPQHAALIDEFVRAALGEQVVPQQPEELTEEEKAMLQQRQQQTQPEELTEEEKTDIHVDQYIKTWLRDVSEFTPTGEDNKDFNVLGLFKQKWPRLYSGLVGAAEYALSDKNKHRFFSHSSYKGEQPEDVHKNKKKQKEWINEALSTTIQSPTARGNHGVTDKITLNDIKEQKILEGVEDSKDGLIAALRLLDPIHQYVIGLVEEGSGEAERRGSNAWDIVEKEESQYMKGPKRLSDLGKPGEKGFDPGESQKLTTKDELSDEEVASINSTLLAKNTAETNAYKNIGSEVAGVFRRAQVKGARKGSEYATFADLFEIYTELANSNLTSLMRKENIVDLDKFKRTGVGEYSYDKRSLKIEQIRNQPGKFSIITKNFFKKLVSPAEFIAGLQQRADLRQRIINADAGGYASTSDKEGYVNQFAAAHLKDINPDPSWQRELIESTLVRGQDGITGDFYIDEDGKKTTKPIASLETEMDKIGNKGVTEAGFTHRSLSVMPSLSKLQQENPEQFSSDAMSGFFGMVGSHKFFRDPRITNITKRIRDEYPDLIRGDHGTLWVPMGKTTDDIRSYLGDSPIGDGLPIYIPHLHKAGSSLSDIAEGELSNTEIYYRLTSKDGVIPKDKYDMLTDAAAIRSEAPEYEESVGQLEANLVSVEETNAEINAAVDALRKARDTSSALEAGQYVTDLETRLKSISQDPVKFVKYRPKPSRKQRKTQEEYVRMKIAMIHSRRIIEARIKMLQARCLTKIAFINAASQYVR